MSLFPVAYLCKDEESDCFVRVANSPKDFPNGQSFMLLKGNVTIGEEQLMEQTIERFISHFNVKF